MRTLQRRRDGFTILELMIVVVVIGILAAIATIKYADLMRKANEGEAKGNLGAIRTALSIYYSDVEMTFPSSMGALTIGGRYLRSLPGARTPNYHSESAAVTAGSAPSDTSGWFYDNIASDSNFGSAAINCTHTDSKGSIWTLY